MNLCVPCDLFLGGSRGGCGGRSHLTEVAEKERDSCLIWESFLSKSPLLSKSHFLDVSGISYLTCASVSPYLSVIFYLTCPSFLPYLSECNFLFNLWVIATLSVIFYLTCVSFPPYLSVILYLTCASFPHLSLISYLTCMSFQPYLSVISYLRI